MEKLSLFLRTEEEFDKAVEREALEANITLQREEENEELLLLLAEGRDPNSLERLRLQEVFQWTLKEITGQEVSEEKGGMLMPRHIAKALHEAIKEDDQRIECLKLRGLNGDGI